MSAKGENALARRPREHAAPGARLPRTLALVVGIEAIVESIVEGAVSGEVRAENKGLKKPGNVCEVPFGGARVFHRLDGHVLGAERCRQFVRKMSRNEEPIFECTTARNGRTLNGLLVSHW
jgi:hypothetical protein